MTTVHWFIPGIPKAQPRPRAFSRGGHVRVYDPGTAEGWKSEIARALEKSLPPEPILGGVSAVMCFHFPRPKSHFRTGKFSGELRKTAPLRHTKKPDFDNLAKSVCDCLTTLRFWGDDSQLDRCSVSKKYADRPHHPGLSLTLHWGDDDD